jgi:hypothetical protein
MDSLTKYRELMEEEGIKPLKRLNYDVELVNDLTNAYNKGKINEDQLRKSLDKGEITLVEYVKIIK